MALQDGGSLKQDVDQAPSSLQAGTAVGTGERGLCSCSRAMPERFPASTHGGSASWAREPAWSDLNNSSSVWHARAASDTDVCEYVGDMCLRARHGHLESPASLSTVEPATARPCPWHLTHQQFRTLCVNSWRFIPRLVVWVKQYMVHWGVSRN